MSALADRPASEPVRALLLDFGGTLDSDGVAWKERFRRLFDEKTGGVGDGFDRAFYAADDALVGAVSPDFTFAETVEALSRSVARNLGRPEAAAPVATRFLTDARAYLGRSAVVLGALRSRFRLAIVSNFYGNLAAVCRETGLEELLDAAIDSAVVGASKPDPRIFRAALDELRVTPAEAVFVGDSLERDMHGARALGMRHVWISGRPGGCCPDDRVIASLRNVSEALP